MHRIRANTNKKQTRKKSSLYRVATISYLNKRIQPPKGRKRKRQNGFYKESFARDTAGSEQDEKSIDNDTKNDFGASMSEGLNSHKRKKKKPNRGPGTRPDLPNVVTACDSGAVGGEDAGVSILSLPVEITQYIFLKLPPKTAAQLVCVCRQWRAIVEDETFWRLMFDMHFGCTPFLLTSWKSRCLQTFR